MDSPTCKQSRQDPDELVELLKDQLHLYRRLNQLARRQRDLITHEDPQELLALLGDRQQIVQHLTSLNAKLAPIQSYWKNHHDQLPADIRHEAETVLSEVSTLLRDILSMDEQDSRLLSARRSQTAGAMRMLNKCGEAVSAYGMNGNRERIIGTDKSA